MAGNQSEVPVIDTYQGVCSAYSDFLTVAIHTILYERNIYPPNSFIRARKYNFPVRQNRHPKVCKWIQDAVAAVEAEMLKVCTVLLSQQMFDAHCIKTLTWNNERVELHDILSYNKNPTQKFRIF